MDLALDDHRVDPGAAVIDRDEPADLHLCRARVDVDHADVGPERVGEVLRVVDRSAPPGPPSIPSGRSPAPWAFMAIS